MFARFMKRHALVSILCLFGAAGIAGCAVEPGDSAEEEIGEVQQALPNCVATCVQIYKFCIKHEDHAFCSAELEACKEECYADTCEPGDPECCPGFPTCN